MKKILIFTCFFIGFLTSVFGQDVNSYKYVIVPSGYEFLKEPNQFQLNELTKFLFERSGFEAYIENEEFPEELDQNRCKALFATVKNNSGIFSTKFTVVLKDCRNNRVFISEEGSSREKDYKTAYHEALRKAFESISALNYTYDGAISGTAVGKSGNVDQLLIVPETPTDTTKQGMKPEEVEISIIPVSKAQIEENSKNKNQINFLYETKAFYLEKSENGYRFFQKGMAEPFAELIASKTGQNFMYASISTQGIAAFNDQGDLAVEILNKETNTTETRIYEFQD